MTPMLFEANTTSYEGLGIGKLTECISCLVTEERNGIYEAEFTYPITGARYAEIKLGRIILVSHDERKDMQPFVIYHRTAPISGVVTFYAHHISYALNNVIVKPFSAGSVGGALQFLKSSAYALTENNFTFWTDKVSFGSMKVVVPTAVRALLGGTEGSILDVFGGGEYEFDNYLVRLHQHRGADNGVTIRYGKNLTDITQEVDTAGLYDAVVPFWDSGDATAVYGDIVYGESGAETHKVVTMDLTAEFESAPTAAQLEAKAKTILDSNQPWVPHENIKINFIALWQTEEYKNFAPLERVRLCDTVHVQYEALGVNATAKVIRAVWNALTERYDEIELGDARTSFADVIIAATEEKMKDVPTKSFMREAVDHATQQITGAAGGYIRLNRDANGNPYEQLFMDTDNTATAVNVWRWNLGGLGHSHSGYNGPFDDVAITQDGHINANMITVGKLRANMIEGGTLTLGGINNGNGTFRLLDGSGTLLGTWSNTGLKVNGEMDFAGWKLNSETLSKASTVEPGTPSTWYWVYLSAPGTMKGSDIAFGADEAPYDGSSFGAATNNFALFYDGTLLANKAIIKGDITATSGAIGGFDITASAIKTKNVAITSNAANSIGLSSSNFTRTIGGTSRSGLRFAIGANFGVTGSGVLYASSVNLSGTITTADSTRSTTLTSGYSRYSYGSTLIGEIGASVANSEQGLVFDLKTDGDYIGWFLNGVNNPILIYDKATWLGRDIDEETLNVCCDLHVTNGNVLYGSRIADPTWRFSGTNYAGYTGTVTISNVRMTFKNGVLTAAGNV